MLLMIRLPHGGFGSSFHARRPDPRVERRTRCSRMKTRHRPSKPVHRLAGGQPVVTGGEQSSGCSRCVFRRRQSMDRRDAQHALARGRSTGDGAGKWFSSVSGQVPLTRIGTLGLSAAIAFVWVCPVTLPSSVLVLRCFHRASASRSWASCLAARSVFPFRASGSSSSSRVLGGLWVGKGAGHFRVAASSRSFLRGVSSYTGCDRRRRNGGNKPPLRGDDGRRHGVRRWTGTAAVPDLFTATGQGADIKGPQFQRDPGRR